MKKVIIFLFGGGWRVYRAKKKALKFINSLPRDEYGRWIFPDSEPKAALPKDI